MTNCKNINHIISYLTGELAPDQQRNFKEHLQNCAVCRTQVQQCRQAHDILKQHHRVEPPQELYTAYTDELCSMFPAPSRWRRTRHLVSQMTTPLTSIKPAFRIARALAFVIIGMLIGRLLFINPENDDITLPYNVQSYTDISESDIEFISAFFVRTELLLLSIQNTTPSQADPVNLQLNQTLAHELLQQATQIHRKAGYLEDESLFMFLDQLEVILLDISNRDDAEIRTTFQNLKKLIKDAQLVRHAQEWQKQLQQVSSSI